MGGNVAAALFGLEISGDLPYPPIMPELLDRSVLLTGFGPFPGVPENVTTRLVPALQAAATARFPAWNFACQILPTEWDAGLTRLLRALDEMAPIVALHFGVSAAAPGFQIETIAKCAARPAEDAQGCMPDPARIFARGPGSLPSTFPADAIVARLLERGFPATLSGDAGAYLCNAALHTSLAQAAAQSRPSLRGFVHVPVTLDGHPLAFADAVAGSLEILDVCFSNLTGPPGPHVQT